MSCTDFDFVHLLNNLRLSDILTLCFIEKKYIILFFYLFVFQIESHVNYNLNISVRYKYFLDHEVTEKLDNLQKEVSNVLFF